MNSGRFEISEICSEIGEIELLVASLSLDFDKVISKTGIPRVFETQRDSYKLSLAAAGKVVANNEDIRNKPLAIIHVSQSNQDFLPSYSCKLQHDLELPTESLAFDMGQGCSGFVQALYLASKLIADFDNVLIICCDTYRAKLDQFDRSTSTLFSDAATAILIRRGGTVRVVGHSHITDGSGASMLYHSRDSVRNNGKLYMSGSDVLLFTKRVVFRQAEETISRAGMKFQDVDNAVVHQASKLVLDELERRFGSEIYFPRNIEKYGNTVSSSIPLLIQDMLEMINTKTTIMCGFGVGLSSSCVLLTSQ